LNRAFRMSKPIVGSGPVVPIPRVNILGVCVSAINLPRAVEVIEDWIARRERRYVCVTGVHGVMESQPDFGLRQIHNAAGLVTPDGMPLVWISRFKGHPEVDRVYGPDLMLALCRRSIETGHRHFLYGGLPGVPEQLAARLQARFPGLRIVGTYSPPFGPLSAEEEARVTRLIDQAAPDVVWVGLSTPKQERWMAAHVGQVNAPVLIGVGAAFDFHAGLKKQAPRWMQRSGLEWLFRLMTEPRRLWKRYLVNNPKFILAVAMQFAGLRRYGETC
jgi:N-acetylglucosaminyldiphosphoundecaprenol N-acetyl-beta-D-mannosaminyltransferase